MSAPPEPIVTGMRQIALASADPAKLADFYKRALGLPVLFETGGMIFMDAGAGIRLMIGAKQPDQTVGGDAVFYFEPVIWGIAEKSVTAAGGAFIHDAVTLQKAEGRDLLLRAFKDPEGHTLALIGWRAN
ncbi:VOC family protein [Terricaulis sp.]|uniref:VOC family protein n=1 Tax=Terricaulis sp. TaxID=2768686 RepID=UPI0037837E31